MSAGASPVPCFLVCHIASIELGPAVRDYLVRIDETLRPYAGRFVVHGGPVEVREGQWSGDLVIIGFPDRRRAVGWYDSSAYRAIKPLRTDHSVSTTLVVDGVPEDHRATDVLAALGLAVGT